MKNNTEAIMELLSLQEQNEKLINQAIENVTESAVKMVRMFRGQTPKEVESFILDMVTHYQEQAQATLMQSRNFTKLAVTHCERTQQVQALTHRIEEMERLVNSEK